MTNDTTNNKNGVPINPQNTSRRRAFEYFSQSPQPIVSLTTEIDISKLIIDSKTTGHKLNMLICYYILKASQGIKEFHYEIKNVVENGEEKRKLYEYEHLCINLVVKGDDNQTYLCDVPFCDSFEEFCTQYLKRTEWCRTEHKDLYCDSISRIATSVLTKIKVTGLHNQYSGIFNNPFLAWGKFNEDGTLPISFNFHHLQMDGQQVEDFFISIQELINNHCIKKDIGPNPNYKSR